jgi:hypothetical protein
MKPGHDTRGVAPGWHPPRRWRDKAILFSIKEAFHEKFYQITARQIRAIKSDQGNSSHPVTSFLYIAPGPCYSGLYFKKTSVMGCGELAANLCCML